jgi:hypothetical protein
MNINSTEVRQVTLNFENIPSKVEYVFQSFNTLKLQYVLHSIYILI